MFKGAYQRKLLTVLYSGGSNPLEIWDIQVKNGWTRRVKDDDLSTIVFEICGTNVATAYICSPPNPRGVLGISLPFITMIIKNLKRYFTFEIQILDDKQMRRRFRFSNYQSSTKVRPFTCSVPLALKPGWNQMQLNLANFTMRAYGTNYLETQRVQIHANCRIRRVYFSDRLYSEEELPKDYRIFLNVRQAPAPQPPPPAPQEEQPIRASLDLASSQSQSQRLSMEKKPSTIPKGPASILKTPSVMKTEFSEEHEVTMTSFKSSPSEMERGSLKEFTDRVSRISQSEQSTRGQTLQLERTVTFEAGSKRSVKDMGSRASITSEARLLGVLEEGERSKSVREGEDAPHRSIVTGDDAPHRSIVGDDAPPKSVSIIGQVTEVTEETAEMEQALPEEGRDQELSEIPEELTEVETPAETPAETPVESPGRVETESEFAESEPIPESDLEDRPSSPEPDLDSP